MKTTNLSTYKSMSIIVIIIGMAISGLNFSKRVPHKKMNTYKSNIVDASVVGTWVSDTDPTFKLVFINQHTCQKYDSNILVETDSVIISNTSPQCGITVPVTAHSSYIQFIDKSDVTRHYCFEIIALTDSTFGISVVDLSYPPNRFHKQ